MRGRNGDPDGFIAEYLDGVLYLVVSRVLAAVVMVVSYVGAIVVWRRRRAAASGPRLPAYGQGPTGTGRAAPGCGWLWMLWTTPPRRAGVVGGRG
ncbi:MAG: hypothetical protein WBA97_36215 [Actinophytocola sp.]|uniref:hypothetical protein n=1 Tax=Actinophytocola sp. TaxID=1872138 RepID=UPI003C71C76A